MQINSLPLLHERLDVLEAHKGSLSAWQQKFLASLRSYTFGSNKQLDKLSQIEQQVFGHNHERQIACCVTNK